jgi:hypothetical protein
MSHIVQKFDDVTRFLSGSSRAEIGKKIRFSSVFSNFQKKYSSNKLSDPMLTFSIQFYIRIAIHFTFRCFLGQKGIEIPFLPKSKKMGKSESWRLFLPKQFLTLLILIFVISLIDYILPDEFWKNKKMKVSQKSRRKSQASKTWLNDLAKLSLWKRPWASPNMARM